MNTNKVLPMAKYQFNIFALLIFLFLFSTNVQAKIKLPSIISDNMVLQRNAENPLWGWASPGKTVTIKADWPGAKTIHTTAANNGKWMAKLGTPEAGGPYRITISGENAITLKHVMIGEVWLCSGQSNMAMPVQGWGGAPIRNANEEVASAHYPNIRLFTVHRHAALTPQKDSKGKWSETTPQTARSFSATAYFFGRELYDKLNVPIGLIHSSWGGTPVEAWTSGRKLRSMGMFTGYLDTLKMKVQGKNIPQSAFQQKHRKPSSLYNGMIAPIIPYRIRGVIWYQGENNVGRAEQYAEVFPAMIKDWRERWKEGSFPFYFVQIAPFKYHRNKKEGASAALRDAQRRTLSLPNTGMASTLDIGDFNVIHPPNKQTVGKRLSFWAMDDIYGQHVTKTGPLYQNMEVQSGKAIVSFSGVGGGLIAKNGGLRDFEVAGKDRKFVKAKAKIHNNKVIVSSPKVKRPENVRYDWSDTPIPTLYNRAGLPASSFTTEQSLEKYK